MNTNPKAISVLCYGDSNTYGQKPDKTGRYDADSRWTGILQSNLGSDFYVIEEGLSSRTTDLDYDQRPGRNGKTYLVPCLASHNPIDIVVIMLGTNDLKEVFHRTAKDIANALVGLTEDVKEYAKNAEGASPEIILVSPILVNNKAPLFDTFYSGTYDNSAVTKSIELSNEVQLVADENNCIFIDASKAANPGIDGLHFSESSNKPFAELVTSVIKRVR